MDPWPPNIIPDSRRCYQVGWSAILNEVLTDGKRHYRPGAVVHVPAVAYGKELLEAEITTSKAGV